MKTIKFVYGQRTSWPFKTMKVGESFLVKKRDRYQTARSLANYHGTIRGCKFTARIDGNGLRVTRTK